jgi:hypothetical protein
VNKTSHERRRAKRQILLPAFFIGMKKSQVELIGWGKNRRNMKVESTKGNVAGKILFERN